MGRCIAEANIVEAPRDREARKARLPICAAAKLLGVLLVNWHAVQDEKPEARVTPIITIVFAMTLSKAVWVDSVAVSGSAFCNFSMVARAARASFGSSASELTAGEGGGVWSMSPPRRLSSCLKTASKIRGTYSLLALSMSRNLKADLFMML